MFESSRATAPGATTNANTSVPAFDSAFCVRDPRGFRWPGLSMFGLSHQIRPCASELIAAGGLDPGSRSASPTPQTVAQASQGIEVGLPC